MVSSSNNGIDANGMKIAQGSNPASAQCTGCSACIHVCPVGCLSIESDARGFYKCVADDRCIACGKCASVCPVVSPVDCFDALPNEGDVIYTYALKDADRLKSTSGGIFYLLAKEMIAKGGYVCGCIWNEENVAQHVVTNEIEVIEKMRGSKYVQSKIATCFKQIKMLLPDNPVLFCGTPCQVAGIVKILGEQDNLTTCSFVCGGAPSPKTLKRYLAELSKEFSSSITKIEMRSKDNNWLVPELKICFDNGAVHREPLLNQNHYGVAFGLGLITMDACTACQFRKNHLLADIILSDHWGISRDMLKKSSNKGMSAILLETNKGKELFDTISEHVFQVPGNFFDMKRSHHAMETSSTGGLARETFINNEEKNVVEAIEISLGSKWVKKHSFVALLTRMKLSIPILSVYWFLRSK